MILNFYNSESSVKPVELDETSSKKIVYIRRNITQTTRTVKDQEAEDGNVTESSYTVYTYEEAKVSKEDYELYKTEILKDIEISGLKDQVSSLENTLDQLMSEVIPSLTTTE